MRHTANRPLRRLIGSGLAIGALALLLVLQSSAQVINAFVLDQTLVSSTRITSTLTDFKYTIRVVNQGGALRNARATVRSLVATTEIRDAIVELGDVPAGTTITSVDTFTLRQNRAVPFNPANLVWTIQGALANTPPVADAGADQTVRTGVTVTLDGTRSSDADGNALGYRWTLLTRPSGSLAALTGANTPRPTFVADRNGNYTFRLVVNDGQVDGAPDEVLVSTINSAPVANAGPDRTVARGSLVTLDGSASTDPDVDALSYQWTLLGRPNNSNAALTGATTVRPQIQLDQPGDYRFQLVVSDGTLSSGPDIVNISTSNSAPVANPGPNQVGTRGVRVTLDASGSGDADGDALAFSWSWASQPQGSTAVLDAIDPVRPFFTPDVYGDYVLQLIVNDGFLSSAPATVTISVPRPPNRAPNAVADTASTPADTAVTIAVLGNDTDPDGDPLTLSSFTQPASGTVVQVGSALRYTPPAGFSGAATFQYTVSDGALTASASVTVTVAAAANQPPVVNAGADQLLTAPYANALVNFTLNGVVSDDGKPTPANLTQSWSRVSGPGPASFTAAASRSTGVQVVTPGLYTFRLSASDGALSASDDVVVEVRLAANSAPTIAPIANRTLRVGETLRLQVAASDPDPLDRLTYSLGSGPGGATLGATGALAWTPTSPGSAAFTVDVRDLGNLGASASFTVTVVAGNRPPVFGALANDTTVVGANYAKTLSASDPDGGSVSFELLSGPTGMTLNGAVLSWRPGNDQTGRSTVKVRVRDAGGATASGVFQIDVGSATPPLARDDDYVVTAGQSITIPSANGVLANDTSPEGRPLSAIRRTDPALGTLDALSADGGFTYTAPAVAPMAPFAIVGRQMSTAPEFGRDLLNWSSVGDVNRDGRPDVFAHQFGNFQAIRGGDGARLFQFAGQDCGRPQPNDAPSSLLADIDDDGRLDYVTPSRCGEGGNLIFYASRLQAVNDDGTQKWLSPQLIKVFLDVVCSGQTCDDSRREQLAQYSITREVIVSTARLAANEAPTLMFRKYIGAGDVFAYTRLDDGSIGFKNYGCAIATGLAADMGQACMVTMLVSSTDGSVLQVLRSSVRGSLRGDNYPYANNSVIAVDLDGDGAVELVAGADVWKRVGSDWTLAWQSPAEPSQVIVADLDADGRPEIIQQLNRPDGSTPASLSNFQGLIVYRADGTELRRIPQRLGLPGPLSAADVDGDGRPELLMAADNVAYVFDGDGILRWSALTPAHPGLRQDSRTGSKTNLVVYDLDGDGNREVIFSSTGYVHFHDGRTGELKARFDAGNMVGNARDSEVFVADWEGDGHADVLLVGQQGVFFEGTSVFSWVISSASNDWLPAGKFYGAYDYRASSFDESGRVLFDTTAPREFRNPKQLGTVRDPRLAAGTFFEYAANDGLVDSANARAFVAIRPANSPPVFTSRPPTAYLATAFRSYAAVYTASAIDADPGDTVRYSLELAATTYIGLPGPIIDANTGVLSIFATNEANPGDHWGIIVATDSQGATTRQPFFITSSATALTVPDVRGQTLEAATIALTAARFRSSVAQQQFSPTVPVGAVISQNPSAGGSAPPAAEIRLIVSKGPQPAIVPNVVGRPSSAAGGLLSAAGFAAAITRQYSDTVPTGTVIAQSPAGGVEVVPGTVSLVVSAGNGLLLRLDRDYAAANQSIAVRVVAVALDGSETPLAGATLAVTRGFGPAVGALPTVAGSTIGFAASTRGNFRLTATDPGSGRSAAGDFTVGAPASASANTDQLAIGNFGETLAAVLELMRESRAAGVAGDTATMQARMRSAVQRWRALDRSRLRFATPFAPEGGLPPTLRDLQQVGLTPAAEDEVNLAMLENGVAQVLEMIDAIRTPTTPFAQLDQRFGAVVAAVATLERNQPGEYGLVAAQSEYRYLVSRLLPEWMDALMDDMARATGLPVVAANVASPAAGSGEALEAAYVASTFGEQLTTLAVDKVLEQANFVASFRNTLIKQGIAGGLMVQLASRLRFGLGAQPLELVVGGASLSVLRFQAGDSFIEGFDFDLKYPVLNDVVFLGPETVAPVQDVVDEIRNLSLDNIAKSVEALGKIFFKMEGLRSSTDDMFANANQAPTGAERGCVSTTAPTCGQLLFRGGFFPVYNMNAQPPFPPTVIGIPSPIIIIVRSTTGQFYIATPPFIPFRPGVD